jgi:hypothetical protein
VFGGGGFIATGGSGASCTYAQDPPSAIPVRITNVLPYPVVLGQSTVDCVVHRLYQVQYEDGGALFDSVSCGSVCSKVESGSFGCVDLCPFPSALTLQPGESHLTSFDGLDHQYVTLAGTCAGAGTHCLEDRSIPVANYFFTAQAGMAPDCSGTTGTCGDCVADPSGGCFTGGALVPSPSLKASTFVYLDSQYGLGRPPGFGGALSVELVFEGAF